MKPDQIISRHSQIHQVGDLNLSQKNGKSNYQKHRSTLVVSTTQGFR